MKSQRLNLPPNENLFNLDLLSLRRAARILKLMNRPASKILIEIINSKKGISFKKICSMTALHESIIASHLELLTKESILKKASGNSIDYYSLDQNSIDRILEGIQVINGSF